MLSTYAFRNNRSREKLKKPTVVLNYEIWFVYIVT